MRAVQWVGAIETGDSVASLPGIDRLSNSDVAALKRTADELDVPVDSLATIMSIESRFDPAAVNRNSNATGVIQFMPQTAIGLGTDVAQLREMTFQQQLPYVVKFYKGNGCRGEQDVGELYVCTFCPALLGKPEDFIVAREGDPSPSLCGKTQSTVYAWNKGLDQNKDGVLTAQDVRNVSRNWLATAKGRLPIHDVPPESFVRKKGGVGWFITGALLAGVAIYTGLLSL